MIVESVPSILQAMRTVLVGCFPICVMHLLNHASITLGCTRNTTTQALRKQQHAQRLVDQILNIYTVRYVEAFR